MENPRLRLLNFFALNVLRGSIAEAERHAVPVEKTTRIATLYEAYLWLELGVKLQVYQTEEAEALMSKVYPNLYQYMESFRGWEVFPGLKGELVSATSAKRFFSNLRTVRDAGAASASLFNFAVMALARFFEDRTTQALTGALVFSDNQQWAELSSKLPTQAGIMNAMSVQYDSSAESYRDLMYAGWFGTVRRIEELLEMFDASQRPSAVSESFWSEFKHEVVAIHAWRFDLRESRLQSRFRTITEMLGQVLAECEHDSVHVDPKGLNDYIDLLIERWSRFAVPARRSAGAW